jgi:hypothetical protein
MTTDRGDSEVTGVWIDDALPDTVGIGHDIPPDRPEGNPRDTTRMLTDHIAFGAEFNLLVQALDAPGPGGACHSYEIVLPDGTPFAIDFQFGPIAEAGGVNGVTIEALLAICIDRLRGFQSGQYPCRENALALTKIEESLMWLHKRTHDRMGRSVEGFSID